MKAQENFLSQINSEIRLLWYKSDNILYIEWEMAMWLKMKSQLFLTCLHINIVYSQREL